jgi:hypothetical protein
MAPASSLLGYPVRAIPMKDQKTMIERWPGAANRPTERLLDHYRTCPTCHQFGFYPSRLCHARLAEYRTDTPLACLPGCSNRRCVRDYCDEGKRLAQLARDAERTEAAYDGPVGAVLAFVESRVFGIRAAWSTWRYWHRKKR